jgi:hypothetical protein
LETPLERVIPLRTETAAPVKATAANGFYRKKACHGL